MNYIFHDDGKPKSITLGDFQKSKEVEKRTVIVEPDYDTCFQALNESARFDDIITLVSKSRATAIRDFLLKRCSDSFVIRIDKDADLPEGINYSVMFNRTLAEITLGDRFYSAICDIRREAFGFYAGFECAFEMLR